MKATRLLALIVSLVMLLALSGCEFIDNLKARDQLNKGVKAFKDKNYETAADHFKKALELDPDLVVAYEYLATAYMQQYVPNLYSDRNLKIGNQAIEMFEKVLKLSPNNVNAIQSIASLYNAMGEFEKAKEWYRKRLDLEPNNPVPLYGIGVIDWNIVHASTGPNGENVPNMAPEEKEKLNADIDEGIEALKKALEINPNYADAMSYLNLCYRKKAMLMEDQAMKDDYTHQADRLAAQSLILKKKLQQEEEKKKKKIF
jgi:tetratricopeptide (TPR) repeat protein